MRCSSTALSIAFWVMTTLGISALAEAEAVAAPPPGQSPGPRPGAHQTPAPAPLQPRERAAKAFQEALVAFQNLDFETARHRYEEAYRLAPHPNTLYNLALACERLLDYDAAIAAFKRFLDEPLLQDPEAARLQQTRRLLAERSLRRFMSLPARVSLSAVPDPVTASVTPLSTPAAHAPGDGADGGSDEKRCETPCILTMPAGRYRLTMTREGYFAEQVDFEARVGQALLISRQLRPRPRRVLIESTPQARLFLDDRPLGETPFLGDISLGSHRLRLERRFYLTTQRSIEIPAGSSRVPPRLHIGLDLSGRIDMIIGGAIAGAGLGLMVLRLFSGEIEMVTASDVYKPIAAASLPAVLGASVAGFAGWEMPISQSQLIIGSASWGTLAGFGLGLGALPRGPLPHVLAVGGGLIGGTLGTAVYRFVHPSSGAVAVWNSVSLWSSLIGTLGWAYMISDRPETAFYGQPAAGRFGDGGWVVLGTTLGGVALGIGLSQLPVARSLTRAQVALVDVGGIIGGFSVGALGMGIGYLRTGSWTETAHIAVPSTIAGIGAGLIGASLLVHTYKQRLRRHDAPPVTTPTASKISFGMPQLNVGRDLGGGLSMGLGIADGRF